MLEAITISGPQARLARASRERFRSSRSGAFSWTKSALAIAASRSRLKVIRPGRSGGGRASPRQARSAFASTSATLRSASGSGS